MDDNTELLNIIVKTAKMGHNSLLQLVDVTDNEAFKGSLRIQLKAYDIICHEASVYLEQYGTQPEKQSEMARVGVYLSIKMKTATDKTTRNIADMLIQGSNMGIIEITKALKDFPSAQSDTIALANNFINMQQRNVEELKQYL